MTTPQHSASAPSLARLSLGTAPDSWGVWFPHDPTRWGGTQDLDEVAEVGYVYTELVRRVPAAGPLPAAEELAQRTSP